MTGRAPAPLILHAGLILVLGLAYFILPDYHDGNLARIMVLAVYAMGYNLLLGYTGLLSLGHALFFAAGMYGFGLPIQHLGLTAIPALLTGLGAAVVVAAAVGFLALRTSGVAFMIVTLMFSQAGYLAILWLGAYTRGDEGFVINPASRFIAGVDLATPTGRYYAAFILFVLGYGIIAWIVRTPFGKCLVAIRENEPRAQMLGYNTVHLKLAAVIISGTMAGLAGAGYALLFGYAGATFASVQYSIYPLLWVLLGGAGTTIGPIIGTAFAFYLVDVSSGLTSAYLLMVGLVIVVVILFMPKGIAGSLRDRYGSWIP